MRIGIIGCGMITKHRHAPEYNLSEHARLAAWYDAVPARAKEMAQRYGGTVYDDWKQLIDKGGCDAISVCSPNATHAEISIYALKHGLHVLCEKPMATTIEDCAAMVEASERSGKLLFIGMNQRFERAHIKARELIKAGAIGKVLRFQTSFGHRGPEIWTQTPKTWFYNKSMAAYGAVFDLGIHKLDLVSYLIDDQYAQVCAMLATLDKTFVDGEPISVDDNAVIVLRMRSGVIGEASASWTCYGSEDNFTRIYGSKGVLHILESQAEPLFLETPEARTVYRGIAEFSTNERQLKSGIIDAFLEDIVNGRTATVSGKSVLGAMKATFGAALSAQTGQFVDIT